MILTDPKEIEIADRVLRDTMWLVNAKAVCIIVERSLEKFKRRYKKPKTQLDKFFKLNPNVFYKGILPPMFLADCIDDKYFVTQFHERYADITITLNWDETNGFTVDKEHILSEFKDGRTRTVSFDYCNEQIEELSKDYPKHPCMRNKGEYTYDAKEKQFKRNPDYNATNSEEI